MMLATRERKSPPGMGWAVCLYRGVAKQRSKVIAIVGMWLSPLIGRRGNASRRLSVASMQTC